MTHPLPSSSPSEHDELIERVGKSLTQMVVEYAEGGIGSNQNWRNGLDAVIERRLQRLVLPALQSERSARVAAEARAEALQADLDQTRKLLEDCMSETYWVNRAEAAEKELAQAREALEPFAREAGVWSLDTDDDCCVECYDAREPRKQASITVGDFRRARAAIRGGEHD